ncbi:hypothetical protein [Lentibacillus sp. CBA3610]|uniref:hypothetical protein n=1 Tax=Lentibacillus sp. CBA3610 TaxID=2518176 RepID=UPI00159519C4|nr:hypothetical protein [Lentibacillus sp. CBA3610]QKY68662.1 hypothetical protein Len3610_02615 [Lentibacillus sp. CBA3610]
MKYLDCGCRTKRIHTLDIIRGIAVLGIVLANMMHFKSLAQMDPFILVDGHQLSDGLFNQISTLFITFFVEGKFYPLFSLFSGLGFYIFMIGLLQKGFACRPGCSRAG